MSKNIKMSFAERTEKAAKIFGIPQEKLIEILKPSGIENCLFLDANSTKVSHLERILTENKLGVSVPLLKMMAGISILLGNDPFGGNSSDNLSEAGTIKALLEANKPIASWTDKEVLTEYIKSDRNDLEVELQKRSKGQPFVILREGSNEEVDVDASLLMLKKARKENIPSLFQTADKRNFRVYKIENYHIENRIRYESPLCPGVTLFDGYCPVSKFNFNNVPEKARQMLRLIHEKEKHLSRMEEKQLIELAEKGEFELAKVYPDIYEDFKEKELTGMLPKLIIVAPLETKKSDPFYQAGNHKTY